MIKMATMIATRPPIPPMIMVCIGILFELGFDNLSGAKQEK